MFGIGAQAERDSLAERYSMLQRSLAQSEEEEEKLDAVGAQLRNQVRCRLIIAGGGGALEISASAREASL